MSHKNVELRIIQHRAWEDGARRLALARACVEAKIRNCRTLIMRNHPFPPEDDVRAMKRLAEQAASCCSLEVLLGLEGSAARAYFNNFGGMLKPQEGDAMAFDMNGRNRRPPTDPVNAMLSYVYSLLAKDLTVTALAVGFDPYLGFYHCPRYGRPSLALDLMEEFRPLIGDSVVLNAVNNGVVRGRDFVRAGIQVNLTEGARKRFIQTYERRMDELVTHPMFGYRISYRRVLEVQVRLLARYLAGEIKEYPGMRTR